MRCELKLTVFCMIYTETQIFSLNETLLNVTGHIVVANGAEQSSQSFTLKLGGSFPSNTTWWSMRVVRMFDADYAITLSPDGTFSVCHRSIACSSVLCGRQCSCRQCTGRNRITSTPPRIIYIRLVIAATKHHQLHRPFAHLIRHPWHVLT